MENITTEQADREETAVLKKERVRFGLGAIFYQTEEIGIGGIPTAIIQSLGGSSIHLGIYGAKDGIGPLFSWLGASMLRRFNSNRLAMLFSLKIAALLAFCIGASVILFPMLGLKPVGLYAYLLLTLSFMAFGHAQWTIETNWVGDLVPRNRLGWFTQMRWVIAVIGLCLFSLLFGSVCDHFPSGPGFASVYLVFAASLLAAIPIYRGIRDRPPKHAHLVKKADSTEGRINYKSPVLWNYTLFLSLWFGGRWAFMSFTSAYLIDYFHYNLAKVAAVYLGTWVVNVIAISLISLVTDRMGHRKPLIIATAGVGLAMFLIVTSAWWGIWPVILYYILNGFAGNTTAYLYTNYSLEIFPQKGRSEYISFCRGVAGVSTILFTVGAGIFMRHTSGWGLALGNLQFNNYHLLFFIASAVATFSSLFVLLNGKRQVEPSLQIN